MTLPCGGGDPGFKSQRARHQHRLLSLFSACFTRNTHLCHFRYANSNTPISITNAIITIAYKLSVDENSPSEGFGVGVGASVGDGLKEGVGVTVGVGDDAGVDVVTVTNELYVEWAMGNDIRGSLSSGG